MSWQHTAGRGLEEWEALGKTWRDEGGLINDSCFGPNTQLVHLTKCSVSSLALFFPGLAKCLSRTYRGRRSGGRGAGRTECLRDRGSRLERLYSSHNDMLYGSRRDHVERDFILFLQPRLNYQSFWL